MHGGNKLEHREEKNPMQTEEEQKKMDGYTERPCQHSTKNLRAVRR